MTADIIRLPIPERSCFNCAHHAIGPSVGTICTVFNETILSEKAAASDCDAYDPDSGSVSFGSTAV